MMVWARVEPNSFGMKFLLANPALAAMALLPPIAGLSGAMISYIHEVDALSDAAIRFSEALDWSEATSDVDRDPLIIDIDGDGIETRAMKDAGEMFGQAANDNLKMQNVA